MLILTSLACNHAAAAITMHVLKLIETATRERDGVIL